MQTVWKAKGAHGIIREEIRAEEGPELSLRIFQHPEVRQESKMLRRIRW